MLRFSLLLCCGIWLVAGCKDDRQAPAGDQTTGGPSAVPAGVDPRYQTEVADICFAEERSGALKRDESERAMVVAQWLGPRITTQQGRDLLASFARAPAAEKVTLLQAEARRVGLDSCPLTQRWAPGATTGSPAPGATTGSPAPGATTGAPPP